MAGGVKFLRRRCSSGRGLPSSLGNLLGNLNNFAFLSPWQFNVSTEAVVSENEVSLKPDCILGPVNSIVLSLVNLMHHVVVKINHVIAMRSSIGSHHQVTLHHIEPHGVGVLHPISWTAAMVAPMGPRTRAHP